MTEDDVNSNNTAINNSDSSSSIVINWTEFIFGVPCSSVDNDDVDNTDDVVDDDEVYIPIRHVDTNCCIAIIPMNHKENDHHQHDDDSKIKKKKKKVMMEDPPVEYSYHITIVAVLLHVDEVVDNNSNNNNKCTIEMYSTNVITMESTLQSLIGWFQNDNPSHHYHNTSSDDIDDTVQQQQQQQWNITIQTFPQQPRQLLPSLIRSSSYSSPNNSDDNIYDDNTNTTHNRNPCCYIHSIRICYFTITNTIWMDWSSLLPERQQQHPPTTTTINVLRMEAMELVQCTIQCDWNVIFSLLPPPITIVNSSSNINTLQYPPATIPTIQNNDDNDNPFHYRHHRKAITLSCTLPEFIKFVAFLQSEHPKTITELHLKLHFFLPDDPVMVHFSQAIATQCPLLTILSIQYLDLSDVGWNVFCTTLASNDNGLPPPLLRSISLKYTDNFVDTVRRLTKERCTKRTQEILQLVQAIPTLQEIDFPIYQQDTSTMNEIQALLHERTLNE